MTALGLVVPIFGLVLIGWGAAKAGLLSERVGDGLSEYVFAIAVPALIVTTLTRPGIEGAIAWGYWFSYFGGAALTWSLASLIGRRWAGTDRRGAIVQGFAASQSNTVFVGVPMILQAYGEEGAFPLFMLLAVHLPLMMGAATFLVESRSGESLLARLKNLALVLARNPVFLALVLGMGLRVLGVRPAGLVKTVMNDLAGTASTCALIALGAGLTRYGVVRHLQSASAIAALKLGLHPLAVWVLAYHVFTMPAAYAGVAVLFAAMPVGINAYLLAARYRAQTESVAAAVLVSTLAAAATTTMWLLLLGRG